jgi:NADPH:quinone reductase-like Zn-dependent oxidoreductase
MKAVIIQERGKAALADIKEQSMRSDYVKIKTVAVAVNPSMIHVLRTVDSRANGLLQLIFTMLAVRV